MSILFWCSSAFVVFTYIGYPLWLYVRGRWWSQPVRCSPIFPSLSIIMAVRNEERVLPDKLKNLAELDYPRDRYEVIVVSDGSTDATNQIVKGFKDERFSLLVLPQSEGKASALNHGVHAARNEIIVFADARQFIAPDSVKFLVEAFADPSVGCVSSDITLGDPSKGAALSGVGLYWRIESSIRRWEGAAGALVGAAGCLYGLRKSLFVPYPQGTILDDVYMPLQVARQGAKVYYEPRARGWDHIPTDRRREFGRKVRTLTGNFQLLRLAPWLLTSANPLRFEFVCHKMFRLLVPYALAAIFISSGLLSGWIYKLAFGLQVLGYGLAALAPFRPKLGVISRVADFSLAFLVLNTAAVVALFNFVVGKKAVWVR